MSESDKLFEDGDRVEKYKGTYHATGRIISSGVTSQGKRLYTVEYDQLPGLCHLHSNLDLRPYRGLRPPFAC